ncbi:MAG: hypothetical protein A3F54_05470 [Candidatus Kerfeldbacteria bacterium RIFCSPHIGHO2_12_FULL_48_17]|uniref:Uncharacterized protein n=1 Tax=Candidatus Kerfeldbacteria bacterium RIFCSPHIGHO2_12_FULL_48_17 TaxID=1798542 RepID=A0A1G2B5Q4_9BACT|nr:MAG: hypothetical protein A3F54_05470 [Candidatus Kerfeldbacteria bacterium RIFCSPHIGHO2_12_FULL_48_17]
MTKGRRKSQQKKDQEAQQNQRTVDVYKKKKLGFEKAPGKKTEEERRTLDPRNIGEKIKEIKLGAAGEIQAFGYTIGNLKKLGASEKTLREAGKLQQEAAMAEEKLNSEVNKEALNADLTLEETKAMVKNLRHMVDDLHGGDLQKVKDTDFFESAAQKLGVTKEDAEKYLIRKYSEAKYPPRDEVEKIANLAFPEQSPQPKEVADVTLKAEDTGELAQSDEKWSTDPAIAKKLQGLKQQLPKMKKADAETKQPEPLQVQQDSIALDATAKEAQPKRLTPEGWDLDAIEGDDTKKHAYEYFHRLLKQKADAKRELRENPNGPFQAQLDAAVEAIKSVTETLDGTAEQRSKEILGEDKWNELNQWRIKERAAQKAPVQESVQPESVQQEQKRGPEKQDPEKPAEVGGGMETAGEGTQSAIFGKREFLASRRRDIIAEIGEQEKVLQAAPEDRQPEEDGKLAGLQAQLSVLNEQLAEIQADLGDKAAERFKKEESAASPVEPAVETTFTQKKKIQLEREVTPQPEITEPKNPEAWVTTPFSEMLKIAQENGEKIKMDSGSIEKYRTLELAGKAHGPEFQDFLKETAAKNGITDDKDDTAQEKAQNNLYSDLWDIERANAKVDFTEKIKSVGDKYDIGRVYEEYEQLRELLYGSINETLSEQEEDLLKAAFKQRRDIFSQLENEVMPEEEFNKKYAVQLAKDLVIEILGTQIYPEMIRKYTRINQDTAQQLKAKFLNGGSNMPAESKITTEPVTAAEPAEPIAQNPESAPTKGEPIAAEVTPAEPAREKTKMEKLVDTFGDVFPPDMLERGKEVFADPAAGVAERGAIVDEMMGYATQHELNGGDEHDTEIIQPESVEDYFNHYLIAESKQEDTFGGDMETAVIDGESTGAEATPSTTKLDELAKGGSKTEIKAETKTGPLTEQDFRSILERRATEDPAEMLSEVSNKVNERIERISDKMLVGLVKNIDTPEGREKMKKALEFAMRDAVPEIDDVSMAQAAMITVENLQSDMEAEANAQLSLKRVTNVAKRTAKSVAITVGIGIGLTTSMAFLSGGMLAFAIGASVTAKLANIAYRRRVKGKQKLEAEAEQSIAKKEYFENSGQNIEKIKGNLKAILSYEVGKKSGVDEKMKSFVYSYTEGKVPPEKIDEARVKLFGALQNLRWVKEENEGEVRQLHDKGMDTAKFIRDTFEAVIGTKFMKEAVDVEQEEMAAKMGFGVAALGAGLTAFFKSDFAREHLPYVQAAFGGFAGLGIGISLEEMRLSRLKKDTAESIVKNIDMYQQILANTAPLHTRDMLNKYKGQYEEAVALLRMSKELKLPAGVRAKTQNFVDLYQARWFKEQIDIGIEAKTTLINVKNIEDQEAGLSAAQEKLLAKLSGNKKTSGWKTAVVIGGSVVVGTLLGFTAGAIAQELRHDQPVEKPGGSQQQMEDHVQEPEQIEQTEEPEQFAEPQVEEVPATTIEEVEPAAPAEIPEPVAKFEEVPATTTEEVEQPESIETPEPESEPEPIPEPEPNLEPVVKTAPAETPPPQSPKLETAKAPTVEPKIETPAPAPRVQEKPEAVPPTPAEKAAPKLETTPAAPQLATAEFTPAQFEQQRAILNEIVTSKEVNPLKGNLAITIELGKNADFKHLEDVSDIMSAQALSERTADVSKIDELFAARMLNMSNNLNAAMQGKGLSAIREGLKNAGVTLKGDKLSITDYGVFEKEVMKPLLERATTRITAENLSKTGAVAWADDVKGSVFEKMKDGFAKQFGIKKEDIEVTDFKNSDIVRDAQKHIQKSVQLFEEQTGKQAQNIEFRDDKILVQDDSGTTTELPGPAAKPAGVIVKPEKGGPQDRMSVTQPEAPQPKQPLQKGAGIESGSGQAKAGKSMDGIAPAKPEAAEKQPTQYAEINRGKTTNDVGAASTGRFENAPKWNPENWQQKELVAWAENTKEGQVRVSEDGRWVYTVGEADAVGKNPSMAELQAQADAARNFGTGNVNGLQRVGVPFTENGKTYLFMKMQNPEWQENDGTLNPQTGLYERQQQGVPDGGMKDNKTGVYRREFTSPDGTKTAPKAGSLSGESATTQSQNLQPEKPAGTGTQPELPRTEAHTTVSALGKIMAEKGSPGHIERTPTSRYVSPDKSLVTQVGYSDENRSKVVWVSQDRNRGALRLYDRGGDGKIDRIIVNNSGEVRQREAWNDVNGFTPLSSLVGEAETVADLAPENLKVYDIDRSGGGITVRSVDFSTGKFEELTGPAAENLVKRFDGMYQDGVDAVGGGSPTAVNMGELNRQLGIGKPTVGKIETDANGLPVGKPERYAQAGAGETATDAAPAATQNEVVEVPKTEQNPLQHLGEAIKEKGQQGKLAGNTMTKYTSPDKNTVTMVGYDGKDQNKVSWIIHERDKGSVRLFDKDGDGTIDRIVINNSRGDLASKEKWNDPYTFNSIRSVYENAKSPSQSGGQTNFTVYDINHKGGGVEIKTVDFKKGEMVTLKGPKADEVLTKYGEMYKKGIEGVNKELDKP